LTTLRAPNPVAERSLRPDQSACGGSVRVGSVHSDNNRELLQAKGIAYHATGDIGPYAENVFSAGLTYSEKNQIDCLAFCGTKPSHIMFGDILSVGRTMSNDMPDPSLPNPNLRHAPGTVILHPPRSVNWYDPFQFHYLDQFPD
jgi:hypothetical protein